MLKKIFENFREYKLHEAAKDVGDLASDDLRVLMLDMFPDTPEFPNYNLLLMDDEQEVGSLEFGPAKICPQVLVVYWVHVDQNESKGYGPLLYDIAMEWATIQKMGLASDRKDISGDAYSVWEYYYQNREDVRKKSINCPIPEKYATAFDNVRDHPLAYVYFKEPSTIKELERLGRFEVKQG